MTRTPGVAGLAAVGVGGRIAQGLEGVAAVAEVLRAGGEEFEFEGLDRGLSSRARSCRWRGRGAVLGVEHVDEAPEHALALIGELGAVGRDALCEDAEGFAHGLDGVVAVLDVPGIEIVALWRRAEELRLLGAGSDGMLSESATKGAETAKGHL